MESDNRLLRVARSERQKGNGHKLYQEKFCLHIRKNCEVTVVKHWDKLPTDSALH